MELPRRRPVGTANRVPTLEERLSTSETQGLDTLPARFRFLLLRAVATGRSHDERVLFADGPHVWRALVTRPWLSLSYVGYSIAVLAFYVFLLVTGLHMATATDNESSLALLLVPLAPLLLAGLFMPVFSFLTSSYYYYVLTDRRIVLLHPLGKRLGPLVENHWYSRAPPKLACVSYGDGSGGVWVLPYVQNLKRVREVVEGNRGGAQSL